MGGGSSPGPSQGWEDVIQLVQNTGARRERPGVVSRRLCRVRALASPLQPPQPPRRERGHSRQHRHAWPSHSATRDQRVTVHLRLS